MRSFLTILSLCLAGPALAGDIMVMDPYARVARPGAPTGAAYMVLHNMGETEDRLIGVASSVAQLVQIHTHIEDNGVMKMRRIEGGIPLPAGAMHELARGGDHVMMMGLTQDLVDGEEISVTLTFEKAGEIIVDVPVDSARGQAGSTHKH